ncbi:MAG: thiopurine S-methyltransferase [Pseudomonadota bacterium]|nr:thiopurine S-methyltransferase [Pseudomonadota bacterium]
MEIDFWEQRWKENQTGFHLEKVNPLLEKFWPELKLAEASHVFVPLCGKSLDLMWLNKSGYCVTGVECSQLAVETFFREHDLSCNRVDDENLKFFQAENIHLLQGDFFDMRAEMLADVSAIYDRAALIALPAGIRQRYAAKLLDMLPAHAVMLLITLEYNQTLMPGPPFSVPETEVRALYGKRFDIQKIHQVDVLPDQPRFAQRGLDFLLESVYLLKPGYSPG